MRFPRSRLLSSCHSLSLSPLLPPPAPPPIGRPFALKIKSLLVSCSRIPGLAGWNLVGAILSHSGAHLEHCTNSKCNALSTASFYSLSLSQSVSNCIWIGIRENGGDVGSGKHPKCVLHFLPLYLLTITWQSCVCVCVFECLCYKHYCMAFLLFAF